MAFANSHDGSWMVGGDFNVIHSILEIFRGYTKPQGALNALIQLC